MERLYSKILGALVGVATGDAMGMPTEMWTRQSIKDYFGKVEGFLPGPATNVISRGFAAGEVTDDTLVTIMMIEMLMESGGKVDPQSLVQKLNSWAKGDEKSRSVVGPSTKRALQDLAAGASLEETGKTGVTNGAAMRIAPLGIVYDYQDQEEFLKAIVLACLPTHNTSIAISGALAIAAAISYGIAGGEDLGELVEVAKNAAELGTGEGNILAGPSVASRIDLGLRLIKESNDEEGALDHLYNVLGTGLAMTESVPAALSLVQLAQGEPLQAALYAANLGGDTDTIGAMACAICGAMRGIEAFPQKLVETVTKVNEIPFSKLARGLFDLRIARSTSKRGAGH